MKSEVSKIKIYLVFVASILTVLFSTAIFWAGTKINAYQVSVVISSNIGARFVSKNDDINILSHIGGSNKTISDLLKQRHRAYLQARSSLQDEFFISVDLAKEQVANINSFEDANEFIDDYQLVLNLLNDQQTTKTEHFLFLQKVEAALFVFLIAIQVANAAFVFWLGYVSLRDE